MTRLLLIFIAAVMIGWSLDSYYQILDKVVDWQVEGKLAYAAWKTNVYLDWWQYSANKVATYLWSENPCNLMSAVTGVASFVYALVKK